MTGGEALARQLVLEGTRQIFGIPGVQLDFAMDALAGMTDRIRYLSTRHEQAASYMADGYARTTADVGVCMVVPGPGMLNALAGLATAYACSSPVLCITGQLPSHAIGKGYGLLHEIPNQSGILASLTTWSTRADSPGEIPGLVHEAFRRLRSGRPRPVGLEIPADILEVTAEVNLIQTPAASTPTVPDLDLIREAAALLRAAERPVIYVGRGIVAAGASEALQLVAEALGAPVVTSVNGRGALSDRHPLTLSSLGGRRVLPTADVVLAVGSRFMTEDAVPVATAPGARLILINAESADLGEPRQPAVSILSDARLGLEALLGEIDAHAPRTSRQTEIAEIRAWAAEQLSTIEPQWSWVQALRTALPDDGILVNELTQVGHLAEVAYPVYEPATYISPGYQGTLGYGFPTALGAKVGRPDRTVVSITGDGGFGWGLQELATARQFGIGLITVVFDDGGYGNVRRTQQRRFDGRVIGTDLKNPDYVQVAEAFGVRATRATTPTELVAVLRELSVTRDQPALVHVPVQPAEQMPSPWHLVRE
jgi:acetolactate synthase-1/2/3 large subunit